MHTVLVLASVAPNKQKYINLVHAVLVLAVAPTGNKQQYIHLEHTVLASGAPKRGRCVVFEHKLLHEAGELASGVKYMQQCDVLYQRMAPTSRPSQRLTHT